MRLCSLCYQADSACVSDRAQGSVKVIRKKKVKQMDRANRQERKKREIYVYIKNGRANHQQQKGNVNRGSGLLTKQLCEESSKKRNSSFGVECSSGQDTIQHCTARTKNKEEIGRAHV